MASEQLKGVDPPNTWSQTDVSPAAHAGEVLVPTLTEEERLVMKECDRDSFYQRALPLSIGCMVGAHMLVRSGRWAAHPKLGSLPRVLFIGGVGYFIGKISYLPVCQQKILEKIPNSNLAAAIRKAKGIPESDASAATWDGASGNAISSSRLKDDYSALEGLDDRFRPSLDRDVKDPQMPSQEKGSISHEELRRRNRQEYRDQISKLPPKTPGTPPYKDSPIVPPRPWPDAKSGDTDSSLESPSSPPSQAPSTKRRTNMWGDPIDE